MKKLLLLAALSIMAIVVASCSSGESKVRSAFKDYVRTNFNDPGDLVEVVSVDSCDTISIDILKKLLVEAKQLSDSSRKAYRDIADKIGAIPKTKIREAMTSGRFHHAYSEYARDQINTVMSDENLASLVTDVMGGEHTSSPDERYEKAMEARGNTLIQYTIKARVKVNGEPAIQTYYAACDTTLSTIRISKKRVQVSDIMDESVAQEISDLTGYYSEYAVKYGTVAQEGKELYNYIKVHFP